MTTTLQGQKLTADSSAKSSISRTQRTLLLGFLCLGASVNNSFGRVDDALGHLTETTEGFVGGFGFVHANSICIITSSLFLKGVRLGNIALKKLSYVVIPKYVVVMNFANDIYNEFSRCNLVYNRLIDYDDVSSRKRDEIVGPWIKRALSRREPVGLIIFFDVVSATNSNLGHSNGGRDSAIEGKSLSSILIPDASEERLAGLEVLHFHDINSHPCPLIDLHCFGGCFQCFSRNISSTLGGISGNSCRFGALFHFAQLAVINNRDDNKGTETESREKQAAKFEWAHRVFLVSARLAEVAFGFVASIAGFFCLWYTVCGGAGWRGLAACVACLVLAAVLIAHGVLQFLQA